MKIFKLKHYDFGYIYVGAQYRRTKYGCFKIGETTRDTKIRETEINKTEDSDFKMLGYIAIPDATKPLLLCVEAMVRLKLAMSGKCKWIKNDHFLYEIDDRKKDLENIRDTVLDIARDACKWLETEYIG